MATPELFSGKRFRSKFAYGGFVRFFYSWTMFLSSQTNKSEKANVPSGFLEESSNFLRHEFIYATQSKMCYFSCVTK